jgi:sec-independent protein translocase protein TatA
MAGLSIWHIVLFAIVVILLFGTSKLKNLGKDLGGAVKDFKNSVKDEDARAQQQAQARLNDERVIDGKATAPDVMASNHTPSQDKS